ncbi:hypothetical protein CDL15_Pgr014511 [Punica granatum]|uniref:Uncharacterized protein n=1 Tax=Punica granatum TaxID=22663 RepID=A0A218WEC9_PUNGR|nr:hypothetical protein CDL15_Pgr014511 [Punica granatum]
MAGSSRTGADDDSANESNGTATTMSGSDTERDDESPPDLASSPFKEGEKVLAFHSCHIYEAKVKKVDYQRKQWRYNIHYLGWNKSWDEWVGVDRLLKYTEENIERQEANNKKQGLEKNIKAGRGSQVKPKSSNAPRGKKRKSDSAIKLVKLPRSPTVEEILQKYFDHRAEPVKEIMQGLRSYFDKALPLMLLYKSERPQYEEAVGDKVLPACVYGAEHLLRLFVKLPELLFHVNIEEETLTELQHNLVDFLRFLQKNQNTFFLSAYQVPEEIETSTNKKAN